MANNFIQEGDALTLAPAANVAAGAGYQFGDALFGVALVNAVAGMPSAFATEGVWELPKAAGLAVAVGDQLYWDPATGALSDTATLLPVGVAVSTAAAGAATARVLLG